ncbi:Peroxisomal biogenesis factor 11-like protein 2 [Elsinoe fawcettii]|nr:Peroxisomal biogenesis factor 11-like protein 2 [Elsinoe fawcettii]
MASISSVPPRARHALVSTLSTLDRSATRLSSILSTSTGIDKFMLTLYYTLKLVYPQISRIRALRLQHHLSAFLKSANSALLPGESLIAVLQLSKTDAYLAETDKSLRLLAAMISEFRMITRLWGLLTMYRWAKGTWVAPPQDTLVKAVTWGQITACTVYQALENVAYLAGKGILRGEAVSAERQKAMWLWSCRAWFVHTALEVVRLVRVRQLSGLGEKEVNGEVSEKRKGEEKAWWRSWYVNAAYTPIAMHYSTEGGLIGDDTLGLLGVVVGYNTFGHMWSQSS